MSSHQHIAAIMKAQGDTGCTLCVPDLTFNFHYEVVAALILESRFLA